jgi:hypothetical protein
MWYSLHAVVSSRNPKNGFGYNRAGGARFPFSSAGVELRLPRRCQASPAPLACASQLAAVCCALESAGADVDDGVVPSDRHARRLTNHNAGVDSGNGRVGRRGGQLLGRDRMRVCALIRSGELVAMPADAAGPLQVDRASLDRWMAAGGSGGAPISPRNAWALIALASGDQSFSERCFGLLERAEDVSRARARLENRACSIWRRACVGAPRPLYCACRPGSSTSSSTTPAWCGPCSAPPAPTAGSAVLRLSRTGVWTRTCRPVPSACSNNWPIATPILQMGKSPWPCCYAQSTASGPFPPTTSSPRIPWPPSTFLNTRTRLPVTSAAKSWAN